MRIHAIEFKLQMWVSGKLRAELLDQLLHAFDAPRPGRGLEWTHDSLDGEVLVSIRFLQLTVVPHVRRRKRIGNEIGQGTVAIESFGQQVEL